MGLLKSAFPAGCLAALMVGCPGRHEYAGAACDAVHPCPAPLVCSNVSAEAVCVVALSVDSGTGGGNSGGGSGGSSGGSTGGGFLPGNQLMDPSFSDSSPLWVLWESDGAIQRDYLNFRTAPASLSADESTTFVESVFSMLAVSTPGVYCVEGWVKGTGRATVAMSYRPAIGSEQTSGNVAGSSVTLDSSRFVRLRTEMSVSNGTIAKIRFEARGPLWLDDVGFARSTTGSCP